MSWQTKPVFMATAAGFDLLKRPEDVNLSLNYRNSGSCRTYYLKPNEIAELRDALTLYLEGPDSGGPG